MRRQPSHFCATHPPFHATRDLPVFERMQVPRWPSLLFLRNLIVFPSAPQVQSFHAVVQLLPPQERYPSSLRNSVRSRAWMAKVEGCSFKVRQCFWGGELLLLVLPLIRSLGGASWERRGLKEV